MKYKGPNVVLFLSLFLNLSLACAQLDDGRPVIVLLTPESVYAGSIDDDQPRYQTEAIEGLFSNDQYGMLDNPFAFEIVLQRVFHNGLIANPEKQMLIVAIPPENSRETWLKIVSILFDRFNIPEIYIHETESWDMAITPELTPGAKLYWTSEGENN